MVIILFSLSVILLVIGLIGFIFAIHLIIDDGDITGLIIGLYSLVLGTLGYINPVYERIESVDKNTYHVFLSDKFVKVTTLSGDDMLQSTDYWTITNIDRHVVEKSQKMNIFSIDIGYATYKLVEKKVEESNDKNND